MMGKIRTIQSKRRQRRKQALRKKIEKKKRSKDSHSSQSSATMAAHGSGLSQECVSDVKDSPTRNEEVLSSSYGSPGSPPSTPSSYISRDENIVHDDDLGEDPNLSHGDDTKTFLDSDNYREAVNLQDADMLDEIRKRSLNYQCQKLKHLFLERTKVLHRCREQVDDLQVEKEVMSRECDRRVKEVRKFWREKIYNENSRSGKILKAALQKK